MTIQESRAAAAGARREGMRAVADRPSQRRDRTGPGGGAWTPATRARIQLRDLAGPDGPLVFEGFASVTGQAYEMWDMFGPYTEEVHIGAFAETLAAGPDVPLVLAHDSMRRLARTGNAGSPLMLSEVTTGDVTGLAVTAPSLQRDNPHVAEIVPMLRSGLIDEMSFRFMITSGRWNEAWDEYHIHAVDLDRGDVAIVGYGANPLTAGSGLRGAPDRGPSPAVLARRNAVLDSLL